METKERKRYASDLSDAEWGKLAPFLEREEKRGRQRVVNMRSVVNGLRYQARTGCQWRMISHDYEHWSVVRYYFDCWRHDGTWERINTALRQADRQRVKRDPEPSAAILDSQSVKSSAIPGERGWDGEKKVKGRKRHLLVDTDGRILNVLVSAADWTDSEGGAALLTRALPELPRLTHLWADSAYQECAD